MSYVGINMGQSRLEMQGRVEEDIGQLELLIKDDQWFNIPVPVRNTLDGIIEFNKRLARIMVSNDVSSNSKVDVVMLNN